MAKTINVVMNNPKKIINRILNDKVRLFASGTWARYFKKYTPMENGNLGSNCTTEPGKVTYTSVYAHFQWEGKVMVDDRGSTWAKPGTAKHYVNANLTYSKEKNPCTQSHWEEITQQNHKAQVAQEIEAYIKRM